MRGNHTSGSLNWMAGLPPQLTVYGPPFSIATPKLPANSVQKNIESSPTCFSHTTKPTMTRCTTYSTDIHLIYAIFRELHGIQRQVAIIIIIPQKSAIEPLGHSNESPAEGQIRLRIPIAREIIVLRTPGQANEALVGESAY